MLPVARRTPPLLLLLAVGQVLTMRSIKLRRLNLSLVATTLFAVFRLLILLLTDGLSVQRVENQLGRLVVSEVNESIPSHDTSVPIADELHLQLLSCCEDRKGIYTHETITTIKNGSLYPHTQKMHDKHMMIVAVCGLRM